MGNQGQSPLVTLFIVAVVLVGLGIVMWSLGKRR